MDIDMQHTPKWLALWAAISMPFSYEYLYSYLYIYPKLNGIYFYLLFQLLACKLVLVLVVKRIPLKCAHLLLTKHWPLAFALADLKFVSWPEVLGCHVLCFSRGVSRIRCEPTRSGSSPAADELWECNKKFIFSVFCLISFGLVFYYLNFLFCLFVF